MEFEGTDAGTSWGATAFLEDRGSSRNIIVTLGEYERESDGNLSERGDGAEMHCGFGKIWREDCTPGLESPRECFDDIMIGVVLVEYQGRLWTS